MISVNTVGVAVENAQTNRLVRDMIDVNFSRYPRFICVPFRLVNIMVGVNEGNGMVQIPNDYSFSKDYNRCKYWLRTHGNRFSNV